MDGTVHTANASTRQMDSTGPIDPFDVLAQSPRFDDILGSGRFDGNLSLPATDQTHMMNSIIEIFALEEEQPGEDVQIDEGGEEVVDLEDQRKRTDRLKGALELLGNLWWAGSEHMDVVTEKLADGSRDPKWRIPLGDSGILNFYLEMMSAHSPKHTLKIQILRLIGNSCADTDENRARLVASNCLSSIVLQLNDTSLLPFAIPVLYNICIDYEPAQLQASNSYLSKELIELISSPRFNGSEPFLGYVSKLLDLMVAHPTEFELAPENTGIVLLKIAADKETPTDMEDFIALVNTAVFYLQHEKFQKTLIAEGGLDTSLAVLVDSYTRFDSHPSIGFPSSHPDLDDAKILSHMRSNLNQVLSDISALPEFKEAVPIISPFSASLRRWLSSPQKQLQVCACIMLGNLARSDAACEEFVHTSQVHKPLISIITDANESQLLHAALGFLKNLALPVNNKEKLAEDGLMDILPRLWSMDTLQQIQFASVSIARQLINGTYSNVRRIARRLSMDHNSPASSRTKVSLLIALFDRTDVEPIKMEISRLIAAICRVYNSLQPGPDEHQVAGRKHFFERHPDIGRPLSFMVSQTKWPVVRSEGWFVFALMARYPEGAECISDLFHDVNVFEVLVELMTGKNIIDYKPGSPSATNSQYTSPSNNNTDAGTPGMLFESQTPESVQPHAQASEMQRIDRMNALVLLSELLKNRGDKMAVMRRTLFEDLLQGGGQIVMAYGESNPGAQGDMVRAHAVPRPPPDVSVNVNTSMQDLVKQSFSELS